MSLALGAEATFVARSLDSDRKHLSSVLRAAAQHRGTALVEIYQNCPIFNDGAFDVLKDRDSAQGRLLHLVDGEPVALGVDGARQVVVRTPDGSLAVVPEADADPAAVVRHDASNPDPSQQFALSRLDGADMAHVPLGIFRNVERPTYDDQVREQVGSAVAKRGGPVQDTDLGALIAGRDTWTVGA